MKAIIIKIHDGNITNEKELVELLAKTVATATDPEGIDITTLEDKDVDGLLLKASVKASEELLKKEEKPIERNLKVIIKEIGSPALSNPKSYQLAVVDAIRSNKCSELRNKAFWQTICNDGCIATFAKKYGFSSSTNLIIICKAAIDAITFYENYGL